VVAGVPSRLVVVPVAIYRLAAGANVRPVWENEAGGITFEILSDSARFFVKWAPAETRIDLRQEARRLAWAARYIRVPHLRQLGHDDTGSWLVTSPVDGTSAVDPRWLADPRTAVIAIGEGLRALHDALPVTSCPFSWTAQERLAVARRRAEHGRQNPNQWHATHQHLTVEAALELLERIPPVDKAVVCHGGSCAPNTLLDESGRWSGHVDLGALGVADRWADLAIATWSAEWNYGPGWEPQLLNAYGIPANPQRIQYYRLLRDLDV
jgi:aminoglycoside phosphotransferase